MVSVVELMKANFADRSSQWGPVALKWCFTTRFSIFFAKLSLKEQDCQFYFFEGFFMYFSGLTPAVPHLH